jgi:hypothetical protein
MANQLNKELLTMQGHPNAFTKSKFTNKALMTDISKKVKELSKEKNALDEFAIPGKSAKGKNACVRALEARRAAKRENARLKKAIWVSKQSQQHSSIVFEYLYNGQLMRAKSETNGDPRRWTSRWPAPGGTEELY